jgi:hypothetical protein
MGWMRKVIPLDLKRCSGEEHFIDLIVVICMFCGIVLSGTSLYAEPFYGFHFDRDHLDENNVGYPAWAIISVYGSPSRTSPGPSPSLIDTQYDFCQSNQLTPLIRLEEAWWVAKGMYLDQFPTDESLNVAISDTVEFHALPSGTFQWSTTDSSVGIVSNTGQFTAMGAGSCFVVAHNTQGDYYSSQIDVTDIVGRVQSTVIKGSKNQFYSAGAFQPHEWTLVEEDLAEIDGKTGEFTAILPGDVTIVITDTEGHVQTYPVKIVDVKIRSKWPGFNDSLAVGDRIDLLIEGDLAGDIQWVYDPSILHLDDETGKFTAIRKGSTSLHLMSDLGETSNTLEVTVQDILISYPWKLTTVVDDTIQFSARYQGSGDLHWAVDNQEIGQIDQNGLFMALAPGVCHLIISADDHEVVSDEITVSRSLVIGEYWHFFEKWIEAWGTRFPAAWFQYGNEIGAGSDPFKTRFSTVKEGYVRALSHVSDTLKQIPERPSLIAQGACDVAIFEELLSYGLDSFVDAYALHTYYRTRDMNYCTIVEPDGSGSMDPDAWHEAIMDNPGVSGTKPWFMTETSGGLNDQGAPVIELLPTQFAYANQFQSKTGKKFTAALWFTLNELIDPADISVNKPWEGYTAFLELIARASSSPPENTVLIDLDPYVNCDGIATIGNPSNGSLDCEGNTLPANLLPCGIIARTLVDSIPFFMPPHEENTLNTIACQGQIVRFDPIHCSRIHIIGCGTAGGLPIPSLPRSTEGIPASGSFTCMYGDLSVQETFLEFSNWTSGPQFGEYPALLPRYYLTPDGPTCIYDSMNKLVYDKGCFLWDYTLDCDPQKLLKALILPSDANMKIFAITLENEIVNSPFISIETSQHIYTSGDHFTLDTSVYGNASLSEANIFVLLAYADEFWCWPGWSGYPYEECGEHIDLPVPGFWTDRLLDFYWPQGTGSLSNILFMAALCNNSFDLIDFDFCMFSVNESFEH